MEQEHRITYKAGITRTPSDFLCADGELAECINLATDTEELKPMVQPVVNMTNDKLNEVHYIHNYNGLKRYIYIYVEDGPVSARYHVYWGENVNGTLTYQDELIEDSDPAPKISSIGKTLIIADKTGMHYFLWKNNEYKDMGELPAPEFKFRMKKGTPMEYYSQEVTTDTGPQIVYRLKLYKDRYVSNTGASDEIIYEEDTGLSAGRHPYIEAKNQDAYNDLITGLYGKNKKSIANKKMFCEPFFVRTALEMYDGTYTHISNPILMFPSVRDNSIGLYVIEENAMCMVTEYGELMFTQTNKDLGDWSDIVKDVVIFASEGVSIYDTTSDQETTGGNRDLIDGIDFDGVIANAAGTSNYESISYSASDCGKHVMARFVNGSYIGSGSIITGSSFPLLVMKKKTDDDILKDLKSVSNFYLLCRVGLKPTKAWTSTTKYIETGVLPNLINQDRLEYDDYFSFCKLSPSFIYAYNSRLNLANVERDFFEGFDFFMPFDNTGGKDYSIYVTIDTDDGEVIVKHDVEDTKQKMGYYFYYPDTRAKKVAIIWHDGGTDRTVLNTDLTEHPGLHGAYYLAGLPGASSLTPDTSGDAETTVTQLQTERLANYVIQSEVNNPWVYKAEGYNKVAWGNVLAITAITQGLSQGQHDPYPLLVFTSVGIWNMAVDKTGLYLDTQAIGRDILLNPSSVTQTDNAVFFVSKKGLMVAEPRNSRWVAFTCVSERMNGATFNTSTLSPLATGTDWAGIVSACQTNRSFLEFIRDPETFMAYDYIDSRLLIINPDNTKYGFAYAYNIPDGTISKTVLPDRMINAVNDYPDYLLQGYNGKLYSFYEKPREEEVETRTLAFLLTRPMKLAGPVSQASLRQLMNVGTWDKGTESNPLSCVKTEVYVSSDQKEWYNDISRFGAAARYYRLALYIKMLPTERLSGTIITEQQRRMNNMR